MDVAFEDDRTQKEKEIFEKVSSNDAAGLKNILAHMKVNVDLVDDNGMTPLQHACYGGKKEMAQMLIDQGADVNASKHKHNYSALHFAALSGNVELCQVLLDAGAKTHTTNSVGRTASQMASFVGNHSCVAVINNFLPRSEVEYYTVRHGLETEPRLQPHLAAPLHKFIMQINLNPIRIALNLQGVLLDHLDQIVTVLELMRDREAKRGADTNEVAAFKFHYLAYITQEICRLQKSQNLHLKLLHEETRQDGNPESKDKDIEKDKEDRKRDPVETFARTMLKRSHNNGMDNQERFLRDCIREFPYRETLLFKQMVASLVPVETSSALAVITSAVNGMRAFSDGTKTACATCGDERASRRCSKCRQVQYCDRECQRLHWFIHRKECPRLAGATSDTISSQDTTNTEVTTPMAELKKRLLPTLTPEPSDLSFFTEISEYPSVWTEGKEVSSPTCALSVRPTASECSHSVGSKSAPSRKLTLTELREPSALFFSRTPELSDFRSLSCRLSGDPTTTSSSMPTLESGPSYSQVADDVTQSKRHKLTHRYPLLPAAKDIGPVLKEMRSRSESLRSQFSGGSVSKSPPGKKNYLNLYGLPIPE